MKMSPIIRSVKNGLIIAWDNIPKAKYEISIFNAQGQNLGKQTTEKNSLNLANLQDQSGTYTVEVTAIRGKESDTARAELVIANKKIESVTPLLPILEEDSDPNAIPSLGGSESPEVPESVPTPAAAPPPPAPATAPIEESPVVTRTITDKTVTTQSPPKKTRPKTTKTAAAATVPDPAIEKLQEKLAELSAISVQNAGKSAEQARIITASEQRMAKLEIELAQAKAAKDNPPPIKETTREETVKTKTGPGWIAKRFGPNWLRWLLVILGIILLVLLVWFTWPIIKAAKNRLVGGLQPVAKPEITQPAATYAPEPVAEIRAPATFAPAPRATRTVKIPERQRIGQNNGGVSINQSIRIIGSNTVNGPLIINNFGDTNRPATQAPPGEVQVPQTVPPAPTYVPVPRPLLGYQSPWIAPSYYYNGYYYDGFGGRVSLYPGPKSSVDPRVHGHAKFEIHHDRNGETRIKQHSDFRQRGRR